MDKNDWYEAGDQIKKLVQDAVDSGDFSQLGNTISNVVSDAVDGLQAALKENLENSQQDRNGQGRNGQNGTGPGVDRSRQDGEDQSEGWNGQNGNGSDRRYGSRERNTRSSYEYTNREAAERIRRNMRDRTQQRQQKTKDQVNKPVKVKLKVPGEISGKVMKWTGYSFGSMFGLSLGIIGIVAASTGANLVLPAGILALFFGSSMCLGISGSKKLSLARRFRRYREILGSRTYCLVEELANAVGQNCKFVQKDLKKMIRGGLFTEGYLDRKETLLITDKATYQQYLTTQTEYEKRELDSEQRTRQEEAERKAQKQEESRNQKHSDNKADSRNIKSLSPECRELVEEGKRYILHVHECNEKIPDETMSAKLDRLELVITRIFREAEKDPDVVPELKKMMSYYLPTTKKLLDAYCEMNMQPIRGQNIENTKKEIENALDTVNTAFENLLDGLFEETAWDISSDISVLNTMLAQEGLTGQDFAGKQ